MSLAAQKAAARKAALARRDRAFATAAPGAATLLNNVLAGYHGARLAGFLPINSEIDPTPAMTTAAAHGPVGVPIIAATGAPLRFALWTPETTLTTGPFNVKIPATIEWMTPEILIVPMLAFTRRGARLGYGGGFYDRTLETLRAKAPTLAIGFAFAAQETETLPLEPTDQPLDMIVTEQAVYEL